MWLARDRGMVEAGTKRQKILEPRWAMDITASRPFLELLVKTLTERADMTAPGFLWELTSVVGLCLLSRSRRAGWSGTILLERSK
jgi:hypothetical protein